MDESSSLYNFRNYTLLSMIPTGCPENNDIVLFWPCSSIRVNGLQPLDGFEHVFIIKLRHKLDRDQQIRILNVRGVGYKLVRE